MKRVSWLPKIRHASCLVCLLAIFHSSTCLAQGGTVEAWGTQPIAPGIYNGYVSVAISNLGSIGEVPHGSMVGLKPDGSVACWGSNSYGQFNIPEPNKDFTAVAAGYYHTAGLKRDGSIVCWGDNSSGQCDVPSPNQDFIAVAAGNAHSIGLKSNGSIVCWGANDAGQCSIPEPNQGFVAVSAGNSYSAGLKTDGSVVCWGWGGNGQLNVPAPNQNFVSISAGDAHVVALKSDGSVVGWGHNFHGQCNTPAPNQDFVAVAAGDGHSIGLKRDGSVACWGYNTHGQGTAPEWNSGIIGIAAGGYTSAVIRGVRSIAGQVQLGNFTGSIETQQLTATINSTAQPGYNHSLTVLPQNNGSFTLSSYLQPPYDIKLGSPHFLSVITPNHNPANILNVALTNGDADGNNQVNLFDFVVLDSQFGSTDAMADLNGDGQVNLFDYVVIDQSFGAVGN